VSSPSQATDLREALLAETLDEVVRLHDTVQAIAPNLHAALAEATTEAKKEVNEHAQAQALYVEQTMLEDREKFTQEQQCALEELDQRLKDRDAALTALMVDILAKKARAQLAAEMQEAMQKATAGRQKQPSALRRHASGNAAHHRGRRHRCLVEHGNGMWTVGKRNTLGTQSGFREAFCLKEAPHGQTLCPTYDHLHDSQHLDIRMAQDHRLHLGVRRMQANVVLLDVKLLQRRLLAVDARHHRLAVVGVGTLLDDDDIPILDVVVDHGIPADPKCEGVFAHPGGGNLQLLGYLVDIDRLSGAHGAYQGDGFEIAALDSLEGYRLQVN
jgi:hypothetical protein